MNFYYGERVRKNIIWILLLIIVLAACTTPAEDSGRVKVVASTTIIADIVSKVGGDKIDLSILLPAGSDPHSFQATPQSLAAIADADIVFLNGLGLEEFLSSIIDNAGGDAIILPLSKGIPNLLSNPDGDHEEFDPHVWLNPRNINFWLERIQEELSQFDQENASFYLDNSISYQLELNELDVWIQGEVLRIPANQRKMVADHNAWAYFAEAYGFDLIGTVLPGYSSLAEPSARELAALEELMEFEDVSILFVAQGINPKLSSRVAEDTGVELLALYTGSLSEESGNAATYILMMKHNVELILAALNN